MNKQTKSKKQSNASTNKVHLMFISWHKLSNAQYRFKNLSLRALITSSNGFMPKHLLISLNISLLTLNSNTKMHVRAFVSSAFSVDCK